MSGIVVDTSVWVQYLAGKGPVEMEEALREARVWLPPIVASELLSAKLTTKQRSALSEMLSDLPFCPSPFDHWVRVGELRAKCSEAGFKVSTPDAHIAQCTLDLAGQLASLDAVFVKIARVVRLRTANWDSKN